MSIIETGETRKGRPVVTHKHLVDGIAVVGWSARLLDKETGGSFSSRDDPPKRLGGAAVEEALVETGTAVPGSVEPLAPDAAYDPERLAHECHSGNDDGGLDSGPVAAGSIDANVVAVSAYLSQSPGPTL